MKIADRPKLAKIIILEGTKMNDTQNKKIAQVTDKTLVVGVDVGSDKHFARAILARGFEVSKKPFEFANTRDGFEKFVNWSYHLAIDNQLTKIFVALEPTGHYWFNLADYLKAYDVKLVLVAPQHVKHSKEMDDNTQMKNDRKDPLVIAKLVIEGRYMFPYIPEDVYAELRAAYNRRCDLAEALTRNTNRMIRWFDIYFPEYREVYGKANALTGLMVLMRAPLSPEQIDGRVRLGITADLDHALSQHRKRSRQIARYSGFPDSAFSVNCDFQHTKSSLAQMARERIDTVIPVVGPVRISCSESLLAVNTLQTDGSLSGGCPSA